jgi:hypothetical protein
MGIMEFHNTIKIEGQDNNVADVIDKITVGTSDFMKVYRQRFIGAEMYGLGDNPRWFGVELYTMGDRLNNNLLDDFRREFPNVNAEVSA